MWWLPKLFSVAVCLMLCADASFFHKGKVQTNGTKQFPEKWAQPINIALSHYPELENVAIVFRGRMRIVPLATRPAYTSLAKPHRRRTYYVTISVKTIPMLKPILFDSLSPEAQVGVIGHELAHIADMERFGFWGFVKHGIRYTFSESYGDAFEYRTDSLAIVHGLGKALKAWSTEVRQKLGTTFFQQQQSKQKSRERYMNPETIDRMMQHLDSQNDN